MKYKNLFKKWNTGKTVEATGNLVNTDPPQTFKYKTYQHYAPFGDFLREYIKHLSIPKWRRQWDWKETEKAMREELNIITIDFVGD